MGDSAHESWLESLAVRPPQPSTEGGSRASIAAMLLDDYREHDGWVCDVVLRLAGAHLGIKPDSVRRRLFQDEANCTLERWATWDLNGLQWAVVGLMRSIAYDFGAIYDELAFQARREAECERPRERLKHDAKFPPFLVFMSKLYEHFNDPPVRVLFFPRENAKDLPKRAGYA